MASFPNTALETEAALKLGMMIRAAGYELDPSPRKNGADLAAARHGTIWLTFHVDVDPGKPLLLRIGATVWGGARINTGFEVPWDASPDERLIKFARDRLALACKRGREESPDHCEECPEPSHRSS